MSSLSSAQVNAALRHGGTAAGTLVTIFTVLGVLSPEQSADVIAAVHQITDGLQQVVGGASKIILIVGPIIAGFAAKGAVNAASLRSILTRITDPKRPEVEIEGKIIVPAAVAAAVPSTQVVAK